MVERKILYYPTILVPPQWLNWAVLYWDKVSSIVPEAWEDRPILEHPLHKQYYRIMKLLEDAGEFEPTRPKEYYNVGLKDEFLRILDSAQFQIKINKNWRENSVGRIHESKMNWRENSMGKIHESKMSSEINLQLMERGLAESDEKKKGWYIVEENTSLLYMALLAKYLADLDINYTVPSTDFQEYESMIYESNDKNNGFPSLRTEFLNVLPVPRDNVSIDEILHFKKEKRDELLHFREVIDEFQTEISHAEKEHEIKSLLVKYKEKIEKKVSNLKKEMKESDIKIKLDTIKSLIDLKSPALLETIGFSTVLPVSLTISIPTILATAAVL